MLFSFTPKHADNQTPIVGVFVALLVLLCAIAYVFLYHLHRSQTAAFWSIFAVLFVVYCLFLRPTIAQKYYYPLLLAAVVFRVVSLSTTPNLSNDFYRFVWDGRLWTSGINPFLYLPIHFFDGTYVGQPIAGISTTLLGQLNSPHYYSVYPPVCQYTFALAAKLSKGNLWANVVWLKVILLGFELGNLALLNKFRLSNTITCQNVLQYALCPLIIVELVGNIHFEAACIFFMLLAVYYLHQQKNVYSAVALGLAVSVKLLPLIALPLLFRRLGVVQMLRYSSIVIATFLVSFLPLFDPHLWQMLVSVALYFHSFSFNASVFYMVRWALNTISGTDLTAFAGYGMAIVTFGGVLYYVFREKKVATPNKTNLNTFMFGLLFVWSFYLACATTIHPWYVAPLVAWSVFTPYRFPVLWSLLVVGSYAAYSNQPYTENNGILFTEYALVGAYALWEWKIRA